MTAEPLPQATIDWSRGKWSSVPGKYSREHTCVLDGGVKLRMSDSGFVLPESYSYIALDLKGENWTVTSGLRASFGPVYRFCFAPTTNGGHRYNPLTQIRRGEAEVRDAQVLADMLVDPEGALRERRDTASPANWGGRCAR